MESIQLKDFLEYKFLSNIKTTNNHYAYVVSQCDEANNEYKSYLYVDGKQLTTTGKESMYLWEDDQTILFSNVRDSKDKEALESGEERTIFYRISLTGGEAQKAFIIPLTVTSMKQVNEDVYAFIANYSLDYSDMYLMSEEDKKKILETKKENQDYEVLDELPFYGNGLGYTNKKRNSLFLYDVSTNTIKRISSRMYDVSSYEIVDTNIYYSGCEYTKVSSIKDSIRMYDMKTESDLELLPQEEYGIRDIIGWNGKLLVVATNHKVYGLNENVKFYVLNEATNTLDLFAENEEALGSSVGSDCRYGGGNYRVVNQGNLYFITTRKDSSHVYKLDDKGNITPIITKEGSIDCLAQYNNQLMFVAMYDGKLQELYTYDLEKDITQISFHNEDFAKTKDIRPFETVSFERDGYTLEGWVLTPSHYDPNQTYPAILDIHGGPKTVYGPVFYHEMQVWANQGYFVFFMNPRGSDGRENEFADIRGKYGTGDYDDLMMFTDVVLSKYPSIDPSRLGVTGGSYGGFMTNWIIGHTSRFKAAASQRSIANWVSFAHTSDIGRAFGADQQQANTWENVDKYWQHSPLKYLDQCTTPTLFIHADEDYRCPYSEGLQMVSALMELGVDTRLVMFKKENHELSRSGKPRHRVRRLEEITNWMNQYLK